MSKIIVSFSGGKDSTWMLLELIRRSEHIDEVVFFDTGWEFPQMLRHVEKIKKLVELEKEFEAQGKSIRNREFFAELKRRLGILE